MARKLSKKKRQELFISLYLKYYGNISQVCKEMGVDRSRYYEWMKEDKFKKMIDDSFEQFNDNIQGVLYAKAVTGDKQLLKFWARTQMAHRGFMEKQEIEHTGSVDMPVKIELIESSNEEIKKLKEEQNNESPA